MPLEADEAHETTQRFARVNEGELLKRFERERRASLLAIIVPLFGLLSVIFALVVLASTYIFHHLPVSLIAAMSEAVIYALCQLILWLLMRGRAIPVEVAAPIAVVSLIMVEVGVGLTLTVFTSDQILLGIMFWAANAACIALAGAVGGRVTLAIATGATITGTLLTFTNPAMRSDYAVPTLLDVFFLFSIAGLVFAIQRNYQQSFREYNRLYTEVAQVDELKDLFITSVNHELRNPMMVLQGYITLLRDSFGTLPPARQLELINRAYQSGNRTLALINSILEIQRLDVLPKDYTPAPVNVRQALDAAIQLVNPREGDLSRRAIHVSIPPDLHALGEPIRVQQILANLLSNAAKYSPAESPIEVSARMVLGDAGAKPAHVEIAVRDYGLGIPPEQAGLLFRRFVRLPRDLASNVIGNGLGLHLCKTLAEALGGSLRFESSGIAGEGTTFILTLLAPNGAG